MPSNTTSTRDVEWVTNKITVMTYFKLNLNIQHIVAAKGGSRG